ncbi:hypothetical protein IMG5_098530 [Ichthyophthirius multifiliis]|uniref:Protein kinase domain-containing protein n=1 Tax=Ichthyophthirius multifiliis TaxID=5932 RepID=G0QRY7_ICHMU|nr:hypothetical protein IMG5_098530 [Ichthyophthirius multifiliis]EGR32017.1 hypothetical protein IMG5_098530 [Ichthyophthirius multifiliis]|eukprot:XP_004035503.1 hypothetical protein IMG5_098530 [Ichthyophthirius multifiliis]
MQCTKKFILDKKKIFKNQNIETLLKNSKQNNIIRIKTTVKWIYNDQEEVIGFQLYNQDEKKLAELFGQNIVMQSIKDYLSKQVFQKRFLSEYEILKKIGKGKYAKVYKARKKDTGELLAVKYLHKSKLISLENGELSLFNELKILRMLNHPNCINILAAYEDVYGYYIVTELLDENKSLYQEIYKYQNSYFSDQVCGVIIKQILNGLNYVHEKKIMHRDLKPQNIMFKNTSYQQLNNLKIIDFGLAQINDGQKYIYVHVGTPGFVAPEILSNESEDHRYDEKCDIFSVGVILYILLTGKSIFEGKKFSQILDQNKACDVQFKIDKLKSQRNKLTIDILTKLLEKDPLKRPSAAEALNHDFFKNLDKQPKLEKKFSEGDFNNLLQNDLVQKNKYPASVLSSNEYQRLGLIEKMKEIELNNQNYHDIENDKIEEPEKKDSEDNSQQNENAKNDSPNCPKSQFTVPQLKIRKFSTYSQDDIVSSLSYEIQKGMKIRVYKLGLYILFGKDLYGIPAENKIQQRNVTNDDENNEKDYNNNQNIIQDNINELKYY